MRLSSIRIVNFRSFIGTHDIDVQEGLNGVVGPNNTGKSNLLRALGLAHRAGPVPPSGGASHPGDGTS